MKWSENYKFLANDTDMNDIVSPSAVLKYMQDTANCNMEGGRPSYNELFERGLAFILSRIYIKFYSPLRSHEEVASESWPAPSRGVTFNRCYRISRDGIPAAEAVSMWALAGVEDRRLHRVSELEHGYGEDEPLEITLPRLKIPDEAEMNLKGKRRIEYADTDINGHLNNTRYPDILLSYAIPMKGLRVTEMNISFISEVPLGCELSFYYGMLDGVHYIRSVKEDGSVNAEAAVMVETIE